MFSEKFVRAVHPYVPTPLLRARRFAMRVVDEKALIRLKYTPRKHPSLAERGSLIDKIRRANDGIQCAHTHSEMATMIEAILSTPSHVEGCIVEAGCFKGGSTAKLSLAAQMTGRKLFVFDSFAGLPTHQENHDRTIFGQQTAFREGLYAGQLDEVRDNVRRFGHLESCEFIPGWFDETMPQFRQKIAMAFIDVDLAASTRTCLQYLYPLLIPGSSIFSHDGHLPLCIDVFKDEVFWGTAVGYEKPRMPDLGKVKLLRIAKPGPAV
jgi:O-methyltransferase